MNTIDINDNVKFRDGYRPTGLDYLPKWGTVETINNDNGGPFIEVSFYLEDAGEIKTVIAPARWFDNGLAD